MRVTPLTFKKSFGFKLWRIHEQNVCSEHPLRQLFWECTLRCNLNCRHCGSDCKRESFIADMPLDDFLKVLESVAKRVHPQNVFVIVSGGEPLMRKHKRGFRWGMVTSGYELSPKRLCGLLNAGLSSLTLSVDGLENEHNWLRGNEMSFKKVDSAISFITNFHQITFDVVTCVNRQNYYQLKELKEYLIKKNVKRWRIFTIFPVGRAAKNKELILSDKEFRGVFDFIMKTRRENLIKLNYGCEGFLGNYENEVRDHLFTCQAGITVGSVLADGSISACTSIRSNLSQGNIYKDDFMDIWERRFLPFRNREWMKTGKCAKCYYFDYCGGNGMHLRDENGQLLLCHLEKLINAESIK